MKCPDCDGKIIQKNESAYSVRYCEDCGLVVDDNTNDTKQKIYDEDYKQKLHHAPDESELIDLNANSTKRLGSEISGGGELKVKSQRFKCYSRGNRYMGIRKIYEITGNLDLPSSYRDRAVEMFDMIHDSDVMSRRTALSRIGTVCIYRTCKEFNKPRRMEVLSDYTDYSTSELWKTYRKICSEFDMRPLLIDLIHYYDNMKGELNLNNGAEHDIRKTLDDDKFNDKMSGKNPWVIVATVVWLKTDKTQKEIANLFGINVKSMRKQRDVINTHT